MEASMEASILDGEILLSNFIFIFFSLKGNKFQDIYDCPIFLLYNFGLFKITEKLV